MDDNELSVIVKDYVESDQVSSSLADDRLKAHEYYRGAPMGDEQEGRSQVVSKDVMEAVEALMPSLMKVFASSDTLGKWEPHGPEDEAQAQQATEYCHQILEQNGRFKILYEFIKDGLLDKTGIGCVWWDDTPKTTREVYEGLSDQEYQALVNDPDVEIGEDEEVQGEIDPGLKMIYDQLIQAGIPDVPELTPPVTHNVTVIRTNLKGRIRIQVIPPDEFGIDSRAVSLDPEGCNATWWRYQTTVSDLVQEFPDKKDVIEDAAGYAEQDLGSMERNERFRDENYNADKGTLDPAMRNVQRVDMWLRVDYDEDGRAEMRKITAVGDSAYSILENCEVDDNVFFAFSPIMASHKFHGLSIYDILSDIQDINTAVTRGLLDSLYASVVPQKTINIDKIVDIDDFLNKRVDGLLRVRGSPMDAVAPITTPFVGQDALPVLQLFQDVRQRRSGVTNYSQGLDSDTLNKTATGISRIQDAAQQRQELIARIIAECGLKRMFKLILKNIVSYDNKPRQIKISNKWTPINPREWANNYDMTITVGLGTGNRDMQVQQIGMLLGMDLQMATAMGGMPPIINWNTQQRKFLKLCEAMGLKGAEQYYVDPAQTPQQPPPPDPEMMKAQAQIQIKQAELELKKQEAMLNAQLEQMKAQHEIAIEEMKAKADIAIEQMKAQAKIAIDTSHAGHQVEIEKAKAAHGMHVSEASTMHGMQLKEKEAASKPEKNGTTIKLGEGGDLAGIAEGLKEAAKAMIAAANTPKRKGAKLVRDGQGKPVGMEDVYE